MSIIKNLLSEKQLSCGTTSLTNLRCEIAEGSHIVARFIAKQWLFEPTYSYYIIPELETLFFHTLICQIMNNDTNDIYGQSPVSSTHTYIPHYNKYASLPFSYYISLKNPKN